METTRHEPIDFFLGATTPAGFKGYFEPLRREPGMQSRTACLPSAFTVPATRTVWTA